MNVSALVAASPDLFWDTGAFKVVTYPADQVLQVFSADDVIKLMVERDASEDRDTKMQERRHEAEGLVV